ncbi:MAG TPA: D-aminoacyl-tRNA deacylase [Steroidobacteraceae bacterium]|nr:D-aminoacyl-tRNA deacylase [Steroidobacteraceae bacterium]
MIALIQRVLEAGVRVEGRVVGAIDVGVLALIGVVADDDAASAERLLQRVLDYRIFPDDAGRMNRSLRDTGGGLLLVPQFTLAADTRRGNRAGFSTAAPPALAAELFERLLALARGAHRPVEAGQFGASMQVALINDGPVTFWLESAAGTRTPRGRTMP